MKILTAEAMQAVDRRAIEEIGIPSLVLMENAALGVVEAVARHFPRAQAVAIFCGPGNNGGDGLAVGRHLALRGYEPRLFLATGGRGLAGDALTQLEICRRSRLEVVELLGAAEVDAALTDARGCDLVIDALFGTGLGRPLAGVFAELVAGLNTLPVPCLAIDLPSGLDASRAEVLGPHVQAELTVTFAAPKVAHVFLPAAQAVGELAVVDLGIPAFLLEEAAGDLSLLSAEEVAGLLPRRRPDGHKGDHGHALIVAGGPGRAGAAILASRAAVRCGAGLVTAAVPASIAATVDGGSIESMTLGLPAQVDGELGAEAAEAVLAAGQGKDAVALGPGLGRSEGAEAAIRAIAAACPLPLVLDADGLNAFAGRLGELAARRAPTVLTPHPGEMARLLGITAAEVQADRPAAARRAAELSGAVVVLKGHLTLVAAGRGLEGACEVRVNPTGGPALASGGSGDVLTGMIAAFLAQGLAAGEAAAAGVFVHGLAGDRLAEASGAPAIAAADLAAELPAALASLLSS